MKHFLPVFLVLIIFLSGCNQRPDPEELPFSVNATLNLLQEDPQFVMYLNFKNMRRTEFWKKNVSDSLLNAEKTFGSLLNTFKLATGASISEGLDEFYYSNSWFGENSIVLKGIFNKSRLNEFLQTDSIFSITKNSEGIDIYIKNDNNLYFFFKDDFTICASNYLKQIDVMIRTKDTATSGLMLNTKAIDVIRDVIYKQDLWMISTERVFIRGIFQNFLFSTTGSGLPQTDTSGNPQNNDSLADQKTTIENLYKKFNSISFSADMGDDLKLLIQGECIDTESSKYLRSIINGLLTIAKFTDRENKSAVRMLDKIKLNRYDEDVFVEMTVDESNLQDLRKTDFLSKPE